MSSETKVVTDIFRQLFSPYVEWSQTVDWWSLFRLTRLHMFPIGSDVSAAPCLWGVLMAAHSVGDQPLGTVARLLALWSFAQVVSHSTGCVLDDIHDRDLDGLVERSKKRPLPAGSVTLRQAIFLAMTLHAVLIGTLSVFGLLVLYISLVEIVFFGWTYPLMKRWTYWPQAWLGLTFGWGILKGWLSLDRGSCNAFAIGTLWLGNICWAICYDTIYACQDREDDVTAGIKSTALLFGDSVRIILSLFAAGFVTCLAFAGVFNAQGPWYFIISVGGAAAHMTWQLYTVEFSSREDCFSKFKSNGELGYIITLGLLCDYLL
ncbi:UbiA prenyltransferase [Irpex rosettiformis]|uniref:UbiA prenyltransferase n=1 Tax=Irpex rosettiformis TaxID=378272 RepID=A0ACB8UCZ1_9APHY|nr:UbiA prenyltransferase [Irpex rosettiformis]